VEIGCHSGNIGQIDHLLSAETEATKGDRLSRSVQPRLWMMKSEGRAEVAAK